MQRCLYLKQLDESVLVKSFFSNEYEKLNGGKLLELYGDKSKEWNCYLFTSRLCHYPLSFADKHLKLWKRHFHAFNLNFQHAVENGIDYGRFFVFYGVAEINANQLDIAFEIVKEDYMHSFLLFSQENQDLQKVLERYMPKEKYELSFAEIINSECQKNHIVTIIVGNDGTSVNQFYSK